MSKTVRLMYQTLYMKFDLSAESKNVTFHLKLRSIYNQKCKLLENILVLITYIQYQKFYIFSVDSFPTTHQWSPGVSPCIYSNK